VRLQFLFLFIWVISDLAYSQQEQSLDIKILNDSINSLEINGDFEEAISLLYTIESTFKKVNLTDKLDNKIKLFNNYLSLGDIEKTNSYIDTIEEILINIDSTLINKGQLGFYYHKKGVHYFRIDNYPESIVSYQYAIRCRENALGKNDLAVVKSINNLGHSYYENDELKNSAEAFQESVKRHLSSAEKNEYLLQSTYSNLSFVLTELNELVEAFKYLQPAITLAEKLYTDDPVYIAELYSTDVFQYYKIIDDHESMIASNMRALSILDTIPNKDAYLYIAMANCYNNLAISYESSDQPELAKEYYHKSIQLNKQYAEDKLKVLNNYLNLSALNLIANDIESSKSNLIIARDLLTEINDSITTSWYYYRQAQLQKEIKNYREAILNFENSLSFLNDRGFQSVNDIKGNIVQYCEILQEYSEIYVNQYEESGDINHLLKYNQLFSKIDNTITLLRDDLSDTDSKIFISTTSREIFDFAMNNLFKLYDITKEFKYLENCFSIAEKTKALAIAEELNQRKAIIESGLASHTVPTITQLKNNILDIENNIANGQNIENNQEQLIKVRIKLHTLYDSISINYPEYSLIRSDKQSISINEIQKQYCTDSTAVIQYYITEDHLFLFYIDNNTYNLTKHNININLPEIVGTLRTVLRKSIDKLSYNKVERTASYDTLLISAQQLYKQLIKPFEDNLNTQKQLLIVPDKSIGYLPFDLLTPSGKEEDYMVHRFNINYAYSMLLHDHMVDQINSGAKSNKLLAFAPTFKNDDSLSELPFNTEEVNEIKQIFKSNIYTNEHATKENFIDEYKNHKLIHLSTHAIVNDTMPSKSLIAFYNNNSNEKKSNFLFAEEIYNLNSSADLIFLSACDTGIGKIESGEGIMSIARAWASTGIKSIITTLWRIDDLFTSKFSAEFYKRLSNGSTTSESLWQTKKQFISDGVYSHPYYWSAFSLIGNGTSIQIQNKAPKSQYLMIGILMGFTFALLAFYIIKKRASSARKIQQN